MSYSIVLTGNENIGFPPHVGSDLRETESVTRENSSYRTPSSIATAVCENQRDYLADRFDRTVSTGRNGRLLFEHVLHSVVDRVNRNSQSRRNDVGH